MLDNSRQSPPEIGTEIMDVGPFRTRFLYAGEPSAEPVVLLHDGAWGGCSDVTWKNLMPTLARSYRVIAPDLLGFGGSAKAVFVDQSPYDFRIAHLVALLDMLGLSGKVHVIGSSFGGSLALQMITQRPERLASVVTISGTGGPWRSAFGRAELARWDGTEADIGRVARLLAEERPGFDLAAHVTERFAWASVPGHYRAMCAPGVAQPETLSSGLRPDPNWPASLGEHDVPVMLVAGCRDALVDEGWTAKLEPHIAACRTEILDTLHSPNIDDPQGTAALLIDWLASSMARGNSDN